MPQTHQSNTRNIVLVAALGYFVDIYDLVLFSIVRVKSLVGIGVPEDLLMERGIQLINIQMIGMLVGGLVWGILGDKKGRVSVLFGSIFIYSAANIANAFVTDVTWYGIIRFIAGFGLAGELGAGITLVSESMSKEKRGYGAMIVASVGLLGAVCAALVGDYATWQMAYIIGGVLGLVLLLLRIGVHESGMFSNINVEGTERGNFFKLFSSKKYFKKYLYSILIGVPIWFLVGIPVTFSPEFGKALGIAEPLSAGKAIMFCYAGLALGDVLSGYLSQLFRSRIKILVLFIILTFLSIVYTMYANISSASAWYVACTLMGIAGGYVALFVSIASEQFGTNIRATVTTTAPNFVRASVVPVTLSFTALKSGMGLLNAAFLVGTVTVLLALWAARGLEETFGKDLDYVE
jgi:MFS transporter, putative metabolite:H+ symporter